MPHQTLDRTRITPAIRSIMADHLNIASVLNSLRIMIARPDDAGGQPNYALLSRALAYMDRFAATVHHPKEERFLFQALAGRVPAMAPAFAWLHCDHRDGYRKLARVRNALIACQGGDASVWPLLREEAEEYIAMEFAHMAREEEKVIPVALETLTPEDWRWLDKAFHHQDPLFGVDRQHEFEPCSHASWTAATGAA